VISAKLERGTAHVVLYNQVGFDVLNDGDGNQGFFIVDLMDPFEEEVLRQVVLVGRFPPGDSLELSFDLTDLAVTNRMVARVSGFMPGSGCKDVVLTPESGFRARVELEDVVASSVEVFVGDGALRIPERSFALPAAVARRLRKGEAELTLEVEIDTRIPADVEIGMSAAGTREDLFTQRAALYTPLLIPAGVPDSPQGIRKLYVIQADRLSDADRLFLDTRNRFLLPRPMVLRGGEAVTYRVRLRAEVPSR
jgi:hypothetical protein